MTLLGLIFIPLTVVVFFWKPVYLLPILIVASVFEPGSVLNGSIGNFEFGVAPFFFVEIFIALQLLLWVWQQGKLLPPEKTFERGIAVPLLAFLVWSLGSAFVMPRVFAGMPVYFPREGGEVTYNNLASLQWSLSNLAQGIYLALNIAAVLFAIRVVRTEKQSKKLVKALHWAVFIAVAAGLLQHLALMMQWSYPYEVFGNNPAYNQGFDQEFGNFRRINSTFLEPSTAGSFLAAIACGLLASYLAGRRGARWLFAILVTVVVLFDTTSTTGYAAFALMFCVLLIYFNPIGRRARSGQSAATGLMLVLTILCVAGVALAYIPGLSDAVIAMTVDKSEGISFFSRVVSDSYGLILFKNTFGLGVGLGSSRHASLIPTSLSTVGIIGTALVALVLYRIVKLFPGRLAPAALQMTFWSLVGLLVAQSIGVPDINRPTLWALFIIVVAQLSVHVNSHATLTESKTERPVVPRIRVSLDGRADVALGN